MMTETQWTADAHFIDERVFEAGRQTLAREVAEHNAAVAAGKKAALAEWPYEMRGGRT
jgi:hypothetical protein